jgi:hypothetical protein
LVHGLIQEGGGMISAVGYLTWSMAQQRHSPAPERQSGFRSLRQRPWYMLARSQTMMVLDEKSPNYN